MSLKLLKFHADWCGPCTQQDSILEDFETVPIEPVDVDESPEVANEYGVRGVPSLLLIDDDTIVENWTGVTQVYEIESEIVKYQST